MSSTKMKITESFKYNAHNEAYLYSLNRNLFINEPSSSVFSKQYKDKLKTEKSFYIILGTDSGLLLNYIIEQEDVSDTRYLFIELDDYIDVIKEKTNYKEWPENIRITTPNNWKKDAADFNVDLYIYKDTLLYVKSIAAIDSYLPAYSEANLNFEKEYQPLRFFTRASLVVSPFMSTQLANICENNFPASKLKNTFSGKSAVVLAGGPSLDENIAWVKENKRNLVVIAVSRIARKLLQEDLIPHIIVSVDPFEISFDVSKELLKFPPEVLFIHSNNVTPLLLGQWQGKRAYMGKRFAWDVKKDDKNTSTGGPTVTNTALKAAIEMGFSTILLSGVDLCFSDKGVSHASGSNEAKIGPTLGQAGAWVDTYAGNKVETLIVFENAAESISGQAEAAAKQGTVIYNLSQNAARIDSIDHVPSEAISFEDEDNDFTKQIATICPTISLVKVREDQNKVLSEVSSKLLDVKKVFTLVKEALECNKKLFETKGKEQENYRYKLKMDKIESQLNSRYKTTTKFIKNFGIDKFILSAQTDSAEEWSNDKLEETGRLYYQAYIDSCKSLIKHLTNTQERVLSRIEEHKSQPDFKSLLSQWQKDKNIGRAIVWKNSPLHTSVKIPETFIQSFEQFNSDFLAIIANEKTAHLTRTIKEASLHGVRRKVITLFQQRNIEALKVLSQSLELHKKTSEDATPLYNLSLAYLYCALEEYDESLFYFDALPKEAIHEDELQQIMTIAFKLSNYELASACLEKLSDITDIYLPKYAKLSKLLGDTDKAVQLYSDYLSACPDDTSIWLEVGQLYFEMKIMDAALLAFNMVLSQEPTNMSALAFIEKLPST